MKHKKRAGESRRPTVGRPTTTPNLDAHLEVFAKAVAEGSSRVRAAEICGRKRGSASFLYAQPGVKERIAELRTLAKNTTEKAVTENAIRVIRLIDTDRNEIIMGLVDCVRDVDTPVARLAMRVKALSVLADIFMLRAKNLQDIENFYGWSADELHAWANDGTIPIRFRHLFGPDGPTGGLKRENLRTENGGEQPGGPEVGGGGNPGRLRTDDQPIEDQGSIITHDFPLQTKPYIGGGRR